MAATFLSAPALTGACLARVISAVPICLRQNAMLAFSLFPEVLDFLIIRILIRRNVPAGDWAPTSINCPYTISFMILPRVILSSWFLGELGLKNLLLMPPLFIH